MYDYKGDKKQLSAESEMGTFEGLENISSDFKLQKGRLPQWAVDWSRNKLNMDARNIKLYTIDKPNNDGFVAKASGNDIFINSGHRDDEEVIKHELTHIYQQAIGSAKKSNANNPELEKEAIDVSNGKNPHISKNSEFGQSFVTPKENTGVVQGFDGSAAKNDNEDEVVVIRPSQGTILTSDDTRQYSGCKKIKIDEGVTDIDQFAFSDFGNLRNVDMTNVTKIDESAFWGCASLNSVEMPNVLEIGVRAFRECKSLSNIYMPNVRKIGEEAFRACISLISVDMPNATEIDRNAFWICTKLSSVNIPNITKIVLGTFATCIRLSSIKMPNVTKICEKAFNGCGALINVEMPNVMDIDSYAFVDCTSLKKVTVPYYCNCSQNAFPDVCKVEYGDIPDASGIDKLKLMQLYETGKIKPGDFLEDIDISTIDFANENNYYLLIDALYNESVKLTDVISKFKIKPEDLLTIDKYGFDIYDAYVKNWIAEDEIKRLMPNINIFSKMDADSDAKYYPSNEIDLGDVFKKNLSNFEKLNKMPESIISEFSKMYRGNSPLCNGMRSGIYHYSDDAITEGQFLTNLMPYIRNAGNDDMKLYRGIRGFEAIDYMANMPIGSFQKNKQCIKEKEIFDRSFTSTTIREGMAKDYANYKNFANYGTNGKDAVVLEMTIPKGIRLRMMPIANENDEVVLNKFQKLKVNEVKEGKDNVVVIKCEAIEDKDNLCKTEKDVYESSEFKKYQEEFEVDLGKYLYKSDEAYAAVQKGINLLAGKRNSEKGLREIFFSNKKYTTESFSGNVTEFGGQDLTDEELEALLKDQKPTDEELKSHSTTVAGNLREKLGAFQFAVDNGTLDFYSGNYQGSVDFEPYIERRDRTNEDQEKLRRNFDYQDNELQLFRSARERRYQEKFQKNGRTPITYGGMLFRPQYKRRDIDSFYGKRLVAGTSGTAMRLLSKYREQISSDKTDLLNFRLVLMACMLPEKNHSLYEILEGSHEVGVKGYENLSTADTMDKTIDPLGEDRVRKYVCKDQKFPYERALKDYSKKNMR